MAYKQENFLSHSLETEKSKVEALAGSVPGPASLMAVFSLCTHLAEGVRELSEVSSISTMHEVYSSQSPYL